MDNFNINDTYIDHRINYIVGNENTGYTITDHNECTHSNGFYTSIDRWWGKEQVFACSDCCKLIPIKK